MFGAHLLPVVRHDAQVGQERDIMGDVNERKLSLRERQTGGPCRSPVARLQELERVGLRWNLSIKHLVATCVNIPKVESETNH